MSNEAPIQEIKTTVMYSADLLNGNRVEMFINPDNSPCFVFLNSKTNETTKLSMSIEAALVVEKMIHEVVSP